jgi:hypothetical protein
VYLGDTEEGVVDGAPTVLEIWDGYVVKHRGLPERLMVFSSEGSFVRFIGRPGQGPGEFASIASIAAGDDGLVWLLDEGNQRFVSVANDGEIGTEVPSRWGSVFRWMVPKADGTVIVNGHIPTTDLVARWVHRVRASDGELLWSVGDSEVGYTGLAAERVLAEDGAGGVWVAHSRREYEIYRLNEDGQRTMTISPNRAWFDEWAEEPSAISGDGAGLLRPTSRIFGLRAFGDRLVVIGATPDPDWSDASDDGFLDIGRRFDTVIEVFDVADGSLVSSKTFDLKEEMLVGFTNEGHAIGWRTRRYFDQIGIWRVDPGR